LLSALELTEADLTVPMRKVDAAIETWEKCVTSNKWPGYPKGINPAELPPWHNRAWLERELMEEPDA
jgi:hypothetical protein